MQKQPLFIDVHVNVSHSTVKKITFFFAEVSVGAAVAFFVAAADFFAGFDFPACLVDCPVVFAALFVVVDVVDFAAFSFYPFFQGSVN